MITLDFDLAHYLHLGGYARAAGLDRDQDRWRGADPDMPREVRVRQELSRRFSLPRRQQPDPFSAVSAHESHGFGDVAVVAYHNAAVVGVVPTVIQQMHGDIDVRALLLRLDHLHRALRPRWPCERRPDPVSQEMSEIHLDLGPVALERAQIDVLTLGLRLVRGRPRYSCREVLELDDVVARLEDPVQQRDRIQPLERRPLEGTIVEIEPVHVDEGAH